MKKGFTLIELLAVIAVLALIALIIFPVVSAIINDYKSSSLLKSAESYISAVELSLNNKNINENFNFKRCKIIESGNIYCNGNLINIDTKHTNIDNGYIILDNMKVLSSSVCIGNKLIININEEYTLLDNCDLTAKKELKLQDSTLSMSLKNIISYCVTTDDTSSNCVWNRVTSLEGTYEFTENGTYNIFFEDISGNIIENDESITIDNF